MQSFTIQYKSPRTGKWTTHSHLSCTGYILFMRKLFEAQAWINSQSVPARILIG